MRRLRFAFAGIALTAVLYGCGLFSDPTPSAIAFRMTGDTGKQVRIIYSKRFVTGQTEVGVTRVNVFGSDTVNYTLPFDTLIDISMERRWFVQAESMEGDTLEVNVVVDVDDRNLVRDFGGIFPDEPWHFVYAYNHVVTTALEVEF